MKIAPRSIEQVRETASIVEVASEFTALRRQGAHYTGLCPFPDHSEKTPSFSVTPDKGFYYCFGCQRGGDAIKLVSELRNLSFVESISYLADRSGIELEYEGNSPEEARAARERNERRRSGYKALAAAAAYYHKYLSEASSDSATAARGYLYDRGISESTIKEFRLGFAPAGGGAGFLQVARRVLPDVDRKTLDEAGLLSPRGGERFAGRITFPISDRRGRIVGFGARSLGDAEPKYLNSPETGLFNKRDLVYGFPQVAEGIRKQGAALVVEGYTDVLMLYQHGIKNAVATLGTAMTPGHIKTLSRDAEQIYLLFDPDAAGEKAIQRAMNTAIELSVDLRVLRLPEDPADWMHHGRGTPEEFGTMVESATPILEYSIRRIAEGARGGDAMSRSRAVPEVKALIQEIKDPVLHREAVRIASEALGVDSTALQSQGSPGAAQGTRSPREPGREAQGSDPLSRSGSEVLALILTRPDLATKPIKEGVQTEQGPVTLSPEDFADEPQAAIFSALQENVDGDLGDSLSDERLRPHIDTVSSLSMQGDRLYPSEASMRVAWLRLRILRRERDKKQAEDFDLKDRIHTEIQGLQKALRSAEADAS
ncbi:DNA primase [Rubrobacter aplysinae]|uniref:DNA primase n=1 Tax=Rubrobacter aplysinae TaxID=909625 RepID=UPI00069D4AC7|nr:DNA primase [Rubrobacter aplysinae]